MRLKQTVFLNLPYLGMETRRAAQPPKIADVRLNLPYLGMETADRPDAGRNAAQLNLPYLGMETYNLFYLI